MYIKKQIFSKRWIVVQLLMQYPCSKESFSIVLYLKRMVQVSLGRNFYPGLKISNQSQNFCLGQKIQTKKKFGLQHIHYMQYCNDRITRNNLKPQSYYYALYAVQYPLLYYYHAPCTVQYLTTVNLTNRSRPNICVIQWASCMDSFASVSPCSCIS